MTIQIQYRRGISSAWSTVNPILAEGEPGYEVDTGRFKVGNGLDFWSDLEYSSGVQGPQGLQGDQGLQGPQGDQGPQGIQGEPGTSDAQTVLGLTPSNAGLDILSAASVSAQQALLLLSSGAFLEAGAASGLATLDVSGKIPADQLPVSVMEYKGAWNASTNTPALVDGTGDSGDVYRVSVAGSQDLGSGAITFEVGDYAIYNGTIWERLDGTDAVSSVDGMQGAVDLSARYIAMTDRPVGALAGTTDTQTLSNKRIVNRIGSITSSATVTPDIDSCDVFLVTALAVGATISSPSGTPTDGQKLIIRIKDNGTARSLSWNSVYRSVGVTLPANTTSNKTIYVGLMYNDAAGQWDCLAVGIEA